MEYQDEVQDRLLSRGTVRAQTRERKRQSASANEEAFRRLDNQVHGAQNEG